MGFNRIFCASVLSLAILAGCGGGGDGSTADSGSTGTLQVAMTDAPSCGYDNVYVTVERIRVNTSAGADPSVCAANRPRSAATRWTTCCSISGQNGLLRRRVSEPSEILIAPLSPRSNQEPMLGMPL